MFNTITPPLNFSGLTQPNTLQFGSIDKMRTYAGKLLTEGDRTFKTTDQQTFNYRVMDILLDNKILKKYEDTEIILNLFENNVPPDEIANELNVPNKVIIMLIKDLHKKISQYVHNGEIDSTIWHENDQKLKTALSNMKTHILNTFNPNGSYKS